MNPFRTALVAGNWKMNCGGREACALARGVARGVAPMRLVEVVVAPPYTALAAAAYEIEQISGSVESTPNEDGKRGVGVAAQNMHAKSKGAFTGEVSAPMLRDAGVSWVILGHSERRQFFGETDATVTEKVDAAFAANVRPIVCVGETLEEREAGRTLEVVERQTRAFMTHLMREPGFAVVAYEPVWAIGTGRVASPDDAQAVHAKIRALLGEVSEEVAETTRILYGGSVKADNAAGLFEQEDIDGALVGGAALDAPGFVQIVEAAQKLAERLAEEAGTEGAPVAAEVEEEEEPDSDSPPASVQQKLSFDKRSTGRKSKSESASKSKSKSESTSESTSESESESTSESESESTSESESESTSEPESESESTSEPHSESEPQSASEPHSESEPESASESESASEPHGSESSIGSAPVNQDSVARAGVDGSMGETAEPTSQGDTGSPGEMPSGRSETF